MNTTPGLPSTLASAESEHLAAESERVAGVGSWQWLAGADTPTWSPGLYAIFERDPADAPPSLSELPPMVCEEDRPRLAAALENAVDHAAGFELQLRRPRADGTTATLLARCRAEQTPDGRLGRLCGTFQDVTEQQQIEEELRRSEELYRSIIACSPLAILSIDLQGFVLTWNTAAEQLFGWRAEEVIGKRLPIVSPADEQEFAELRAIVSTGRSFSRREVVRQTRDGQRIDVSVSGAPIRDTADRVVGVMASLEDITQRKQVESALRQLNVTLEERVAARTRELEAINRELEAFSYSVSHDLRAPLRAIDGWAQALAEDYAEVLDDAGREMLERQRTASQRMALLIDDLLSLSRLSRQEMAIEQVSMTKVTERVWNELAPQRQESGDPELRLGPLPYCHGDVRLLRQLLWNLLGNAIKFSGRSPQPRVDVGWQPSDEGQGVYFVRDNGVGFDMEYAAKLFHPFQRLHRYEEFPGTGIGLATVERIVRRHGGRVWGEGEPGVGATFYFTLPPPSPTLDIHANSESRSEK